ncbi:hypothetical protein TNCV_1261791 [Trichonephila clavipes]|nr:hypothetical protein TNCV_1261791 [Trichonephila clavipes]
MEIPLRTAYSQNGRYGMQPKARQSSRAGAAKTRTETCEIVEEKQKLLDIREKGERERQRHVGGHKDKEMMLITFLHDEGKQKESDYTRFLLLYQQWLLRNNSSDWLEWAGQGFRTSRLRLRLQC